MKVLIKNGRVVDPGSNFDDIADILIVDGRIECIGKNITADEAEEIDAAGLIVAPGLIDIHTHLREPGFEAKEDIETGTAAAAAGGFTAVACMPNTKPVIDNAVLVAGVLKRAEMIGKVKVHVIGAVSKGQEGKELSEIGDMVAAGAIAISDDGHFVENAQLMRNALEYAGMFKCPVISHAEDSSLVKDGYMNEGAVSAMLGMRGRPTVAEDIAVARDVMLAEYTGAPIHIAHVSTLGAVEIIRQAKKRGVKVTAEVTPHHIALTDKAVETFDTATKVNPPLRSKEHVAALLEGLRDGTLDIIASDHAPHAFEEKDVEYRHAPSGFSGLETSLAVVLSSLYHSGIVTIDEIIRKMATNPAKIFNLSSGGLEKGMPADITIIDPDKEWTVDSSLLYTKSRMTPFAGVRLKGKAVATIVNGRIIMRNGEVLV